MPITNVETFADSTAFERLVLDRLMPCYGSDSADEIDLREAMAGTGPVQVKISAFASFSAHAVAEATASMLPLLFGAAWKLLDLIVELALQQGLAPSRDGKWPIKAKARALARGDASAAVLGADPALWATLSALYVATTEHRHCLVHRLAGFCPQTLTLSGADAQGQRLRSLRREELQAFVRAAQIAAEAVVNGGLQTRQADHLYYELDQLRDHTGQPPLGGASASRPMTVRMILLPSDDGGFEADFAYACRKARKTSPHHGHCDLWIDIPDGSSRKLFARMEDVPEQKVCVDLNNLPAYLAWR